MRTITVRFTQDGPDWLAEMVDEPRVHSFGRTLEQAKKMILAAAALWYDLDVGDLDLALAA